MFGNISIMFPMIISVAEVHEIKAIIAEVKEELKNEGIPFKDDVELGVMIETPASVVNWRKKWISSVWEQTILHSIHWRLTVRMQNWISFMIRITPQYLL